MLGFCFFKRKLYIATSHQSKIMTLDTLEDLYKYLPDEKPDFVVTPGGPYPFTILRILLSTANGFARGHNIPCHLIKRFDFLNFVCPGHFFALETRRGDFFTYYEKTGEAMMTKEDVLAFVRQHHIPLVSDADVLSEFAEEITINLAEKLIEYYPHATILKEPYYLYTPQYKKARP